MPPYLRMAVYMRHWPNLSQYLYRLKMRLFYMYNDHLLKSFVVVAVAPYYLMADIFKTNFTSMA